MKKYILALIIACFALAKTGKAQTADSTVNALLSIDENQFIGHSLDSLIQVLPSGYTYIRVFGTRNTARKVIVSYPNKVWIELQVREFSHMNPYDPNRVWDITLMRLEKLYKTVIYKNQNCYKNCDVL